MDTLEYNNKLGQLNDSVQNILINSMNKKEEKQRLLESKGEMLESIAGGLLVGSNVINHYTGLGDVALKNVKDIYNNYYYKNTDNTYNKKYIGMIGIRWYPINIYILDLLMPKKIALITGAGSGIGAETAIVLAKHDYHTIITGKSLSSLEKTEKKIIDNGGSCTLVKLDMNDFIGIDKLGLEIFKRWEKIRYINLKCRNSRNSRTYTSPK